MVGQPTESDVFGHNASEHCVENAHRASPADDTDRRMALEIEDRASRACSIRIVFDAIEVERSIQPPVRLRRVIHRPRTASIWLARCSYLYEMNMR